MGLVYSFNMKYLRNTSLLSWFNFFYGFQLYSVIAILYFAQVTGSYALGLSIFSVAKISQAFLEIPTGIYSDKIGRSNCLRIGAIASLLSIVFYSLGQHYIVLVVGAILEGACRALFSGNNNALLYETLNESGQKDKYHEYLGKAHSWLELAGFLGAILGGIIAFISYSYLMWISVIPQVISVAISFQFIEPKMNGHKLDSIFLHLKEAVAHYKHNVRLRTLSLANILGIGLGESAWSFQSAFYNTVLPIWAVGFVMSLNYLISTISFRLSGKIINKFKALNLLIYQEIYSRIMYIVALVYPTVISPFLMAAASIVYGPGYIAQNTLIQTEFTDQQRATMESINSFLGNCFYAICAVGLGVLADSLGEARAMLFVQICLLPVVLLYLHVYRTNKNLLLK